MAGYPEVSRGGAVSEEESRNRRDLLLRSKRAGLRRAKRRQHMIKLNHKWKVAMWRRSVVRRAMHGGGKEPQGGED